MSNSKASTKRKTKPNDNASPNTNGEILLSSDERTKLFNWARGMNHAKQQADNAQLAYLATHEAYTRLVQDLSEKYQLPRYWDVEFATGKVTIKTEEDSGGLQGQ